MRQGFWKNHLAGRHYYHISALFVVDLEAGRLRQKKDNRTTWSLSCAGVPTNWGRGYSPRRLSVLDCGPAQLGQLGSGSYWHFRGMQVAHSQAWEDLPNYIQANLPIYSLPQEWLWCESWCSESSKTNAKTIDMCCLVGTSRTSLPAPKPFLLPRIRLYEV